MCLKKSFQQCRNVQKIILIINLSLVIDYTVSAFPLNFILVFGLLFLRDNIQMKMNNQYWQKLHKFFG